MRELLQVSVIFLLILVFVTLLSLAFGWKFHRLLKTFKEVIKLEVSSQAGRVSLVSNFLMAALFGILFTSHEAMALVKAFIRPELEVFSLNVHFGLAMLLLMFWGNLFVLAFLKTGRR
jgi:hypothetical protein